MINFTDLTGLASAATAFLLLSGLMPGIERLAKSQLAALLAAMFALMLIPFGGMPLAAYVRGATGDLSITTMVLLWCALTKNFWPDTRLRPFCGATDAGSRHALLLLIALAALAFYPMALGVGAFDPYRLGYGDPLFVSALLFIALAAWFRKLPLIALCIAFATFAWAIGWYESTNLWDYLLDPFVSIYALAAIMIHAVKALLQRGRLRKAQSGLRG